MTGCGLFRLILSVVLLLSNNLLSHGLSSPSPWAPAQWRLTLDIGREPGTSMPSTWGQSGARLVLPLNVTIRSESWPGPRDDWGVGGSGGDLSILRPADDGARYVNTDGEQRVGFHEGGWKISSPAKTSGNTNSGGGHAATLQFWLDVGPTAATRNDVTLPADQRLYFGANCWRDAELELGRRAMDPLVEEYEAAQRAVEERLSHDTGDRRLDGTDPFDTLVAYKDMTELVVRRDEMLRKVKEAGRTLPRNAECLSNGNWPGTTERLSIAPRELFIKRKKLFFGDEFLLIGKWQAVPVKVNTNTVVQR